MDQSLWKGNGLHWQWFIQSFLPFQDRPAAHNVPKQLQVDQLGWQRAWWMCWGRGQEHNTKKAFKKLGPWSSRRVRATSFWTDVMLGQGCLSPFQRTISNFLIAEGLRGNTIRGNRTRNGALRRAVREPLKNLWKPLKTLPLRDPFRGRFPSQNLSGLLPLLYPNLLPNYFKRFCGTLVKVRFWKWIPMRFLASVLTPNLPAMASLHGMMPNYAAKWVWEQLLGVKFWPSNKVPHAYLTQQEILLGATTSLDTTVCWFVGFCFFRRLVKKQPCCCQTALKR